MTRRTFQCSWQATITVDDDTVKSALLGFRLADGIDGPVIDDDDATFEMQQGMLGWAAEASPDKVLQGFLVNGYLVRAAPVVKNLIERDLAGAEAQIGDIKVIEV